MFEFGQVLKMKQSVIDLETREHVRNELPRLRLMALGTASHWGRLRGREMGVVIVEAAKWGITGSVWLSASDDWWEVVDYDAR